MAHITIEKLRQAGFSLETFEDGKFWVYERGSGKESESELSVCQRYINGFNEDVVQEPFVLQCDFDFRNPLLFIDSYLWRLTLRDFAGVVSGLRRIAKKRSK